jgi:hypothetical protein
MCKAAISIAEMMEQRLRSAEAIERLENELSLRDAALSQLRTDFAIATEAASARDEASRKLAAALSTEQTKAHQLTLILAAIGEQTEAVRAQEARISSSAGE